MPEGVLLYLTMHRGVEAKDTVQGSILSDVTFSCSFQPAGGTQVSFETQKSRHCVESAKATVFATIWRVEVLVHASYLPLEFQTANLPALHVKMPKQGVGH